MHSYVDYAWVVSAFMRFMLHVSFYIVFDEEVPVVHFCRSAVWTAVDFGPASCAYDMAIVAL